MFQRLTAARLHVLARAFPAVAILGARQVGMTRALRSTRPPDEDRSRIARAGFEEVRSGTP